MFHKHHSSFVFRKLRDCTIRVAKTKALISFVATAKLICSFVFAYAKSRFSHNEVHLSYLVGNLKDSSSFDAAYLLIISHCQ